MRYVAYGAALHAAASWSAGSPRVAHPQPSASTAAADFDSLLDRLRPVAAETAEALDLSLESLTYSAGTVEVLASGGDVDALQKLSYRLGELLDTWEAEDDPLMRSLPPYMLNVGSPGLSTMLVSDIDFEAFKGFPVTVTLTEEFKKKLVFEGTLMDRDDEHVRINQKGQIKKLPRTLVDRVELPGAKSEPGDPFG